MKMQDDSDETEEKIWSILRGLIRQVRGTENPAEYIKKMLGIKGDPTKARAEEERFDKAVQKMIKTLEGKHPYNQAEAKRVLSILKGF